MTIPLAHVLHFCGIPCISNRKYVMPLGGAIASYMLAMQRSTQFGRSGKDKSPEQHRTAGYKTIPMDRCVCTSEQSLWEQKTARLQRDCEKTDSSGTVHDNDVMMEARVGLQLLFEEQ